MKLIEYLATTETKRKINCLWFNEEDNLECFTYGVDDQIEPEILEMQVEETQLDCDNSLNIWLI